MIRQRVSFAVAGALVASTALTVGLAGSANAATTAYDPNFTPAAGDLVGVGSDTIEIALDYLAKGSGSVNGFNAGSAGFKIASFAAAGDPATVTLRSGSAAIARSTINGSGSGKAKLYGTGNNPDVNFARSSSSLNAAEVSAGLQQFPFAVDGLKLAVSATVASNAPDTISPADLVRIYSGAVTNWSQLGGTPGVIKPYVPPTTSGTYSFFISQLTAANSGNAVTLAGTVATSQEHDETLIKSDPNAIAPFSTARAKSLTTSIKLEKGFKAYRAVYNVVRQADLANSKITAVFGEGGFICSPAGKPLIEAAGFEQLATQANGGGVCGKPLQEAVSTFVTTSQVETDTTLAADSINGNKVRLSATVDASSSPEGTVTFKQGGTTLGSPVEVANGKATTTVLAPVGNQSYTATFTPADVLAFKSSTASASVAVKTPSQVTVGIMNPIGAYGSTRLAVVSATVDGDAATGRVALKLDSGAAVNVTLKNGFGFYTVPGTTALGAHTLSASFAGSSTVSAATASTPLNVTKATTKTSFTLSPAKIKVKKSTKAKVTVSINGASTVKPNGLIVIKSGSKVVGSGTVKNGVATVTIAKQTKKATLSLKATFTGNSNYGSSTSSTVKLTVTK